MKPLDLPPPLQPASAPIDEQAMRQTHYNNGAYMHPPEPGKGGYFVISNKLAYTVVGIVASAIVGGGWMLGPAKDRDLQDTRKDVAAHTVTLNAITEKLDKIDEGLQEVRVDVARMQGGAPVSPAIRVKRQKPTAKKMPTISATAGTSTSPR